ncbi:Huntingtin-interacting protein 1, partial [Fragariocoptes setiger]
MNPTKKLVPVSVQKALNSRSNRGSYPEREIFERSMFVSINKAITSAQCPPKEKHVRRILLGSFQNFNGQPMGAKFFFEMAPLLKLQENEVICWKFCYVLHRLLRDGHEKALQDAYHSRQVLVNLKKLWANADGQYASLIRQYSQLLLNRLHLHIRFKITDEELEKISQGDVNVQFQLACELFDCLDDILGLASKILSSFEIYRASSGTSSGQCRLVPLIACIQDSSLLYDHIVKLLFKLHNKLPATTLDGHRERFFNQYKVLKQFYINASNIQYFRTLIQVPLLSDKPPNFLVASDLSSHVAPTVIMLEQRDSPETADPLDDGLLVDLSTDFDQSVVDPSVQPGLSTDPSDFTVTELHKEIERLEKLVENLNTELAFSKFQEDRAELRDPCETTRAQQTSIEDSETVKQLKVEIEQLKSESCILKEKLRVVQADHIELVNKLRSDINELQTSLATLSNGYDKLERKLKDSEETLKSSSLNAKNYQEMVQKAGELQRERDSLMNENSQLRTQVSILETAVERKRDSLENPPQHMEQDINPENLEEMLMKELGETDRVIHEAALKIEQLGLQTRQRDSGIKLEVNEKIAESCSNLMQAVMDLIKKSRALQNEIAPSAVVSGGDANTRKEFYKRNSNWAQGLISAANVVAVAAKFFVDAADKVINGGNFSILVAAAHEIAASSTQLVVGSKVKAKNDSEMLKALVQSSKIVNELTGKVVATSKQCSQVMDQEMEKLDVTSLSLHQTKRLEMESQVRLIDLENQITKERERLGILRKQHYNSTNE